MAPQRAVDVGPVASSSGAVAFDLLLDRAVQQAPLIDRSSISGTSVVSIWSSGSCYRATISSC